MSASDHGSSTQSTGSSRFRNWTASLDGGITGLSFRLFVQGEYRLESRCGSKKLMRLVAGDFNENVFTIHLVDAPGSGGSTITIQGDFEAPAGVQTVVVDDGREQYEVSVDRSRVENAEVSGASLSKVGGEEAGLPCPFGATRNWSAWVNAMPGTRRNLIVTGEALVGNEGYGPRLRAGALLKRRPPVQVFHLTLVEATSTSGGWQEVRGEVDEAENEYAGVAIFCHDELIAEVEVKVVE